MRGEEDAHHDESSSLNASGCASRCGGVKTSASRGVAAAADDDDNAADADDEASAEAIGTSTWQLSDCGASKSSAGAGWYPRAVAAAAARA